MGKIEDNLELLVCLLIASKCHQEAFNVSLGTAVDPHEPESTHEPK